ncbi:MAG: hypothetical protein LBJ35_06725 [Spirochaetaceae bacterium]|nr:hypothetical protein [Spirochaetaceae bacterium]
MKTGGYIFIFCSLLAANSCWAQKQTNFFLAGINGESYPLYTSSNDLSGEFDLSKTKHYNYSLNESIRVPRNYSLEIDYSIQGGENYEVVLKIDDDSGWVLPGGLQFINIDSPNPRICYVIPLQAARIKDISFEIKGEKKSDAQLHLNGLRLTERFYGFDTESDAARTSPFVNWENIPAEDGVKTPVITINPDDYYAISGPQTLFIDGITEAPVIAAGSNVIQYIANTRQNKYHNLTVPAVFLARGKNTIQINGGVKDALLKPVDSVSDTEPVTADPGFILKYPQDKWRDKNFEIFFWESFPNILIFDTVSYAAQDKLFKRIAFFAEKKGFKGKLARDEEIASLHGWNAHDYNAETLARFFDMAEKAAFPLLDEELLLREILIKTNIIKSDGDNFVPSGGAVISISRESPEYLRLMFMTHEAFHGIFFIDADFREFCQQRWDKLDRAAKRFITSYFDFQQYDINDSYLVLNEFMAHCLQQGVAASGKYFGENLAGRLYEKSPWRRTALPPRDDDAGNWPAIAESFRAEAAAFSEYAAGRWGLAAGRVWRVRL